jgi:hypothetical protein
LRAPFVALGAAALVFISLSFRDLEVGRSATAVACFTAATLRWLVIGTVADELFASMWITAAIVWCLSQTERRPERAGRWAA